MIVLCVVGAYGVNNRIFDVWSLLGFGVFGYILTAFDFLFPPVVLGFILGPIIKTNLRRGLALSRGNISPFFIRPISALFFIIALNPVLVNIYKEDKKSILLHKRGKHAFK